MEICPKSLHHQEPIVLIFLYVRSISNKFRDTKMLEASELFELLNLLSFSCPEIEMNLHKQGTVAVGLHLEMNISDIIKGRILVAKY